MDRHHEENRKLRLEEDRIQEQVRRTAFELHLADWEVEKFEHQLDLVRSQWDEAGMENLVAGELSKQGMGSGIGL
jgi:hypothetical protein